MIDPASDEANGGSHPGGREIQVAALIGLAGAALGAIVGYVMSYGAFVVVDAHVMHLSLDAGWAFAEIGVVVGLVGGWATARRLQRLRRSSDRARAAALSLRIAGASGGMIVGAIVVWVAVAIVFPEERGNVLPIMVLGAAAGCGIGYILAALVTAASAKLGRR